MNDLDSLPRDLTRIIMAWAEERKLVLSLASLQNLITPILGRCGYRRQEFVYLSSGLYRIFWREEHGGGDSVAAVGILNDGTRWYAPINWSGEHASGVVDTDWNRVSHVVKLSYEDMPNE